MDNTNNTSTVHFSYMVTPRHQEAGGGWRLYLLEHGKEVGGGAFPAEEGPDEYEAYLEATGQGEQWLLSHAMGSKDAGITLQETQAEEATLYRELTGVAIALGYQGLVDALQDLGKIRVSPEPADVQGVKQEERFDRVTPQPDGSFQHFYQGVPVDGPSHAATPAPSAGEATGGTA